MTPQIGLLLALLGGALVLFWFEWVPADVTALGLMLTLALTGLVTVEQAFAGFGSDILLMIFGLLVLTAALSRTGVVDLTGRWLLRRTGNPELLAGAVVVAAMLLSSFISNTAATAFFLPVALGIAARSRVSPSRLLMPLAFASVLSSSMTLVSTSTNLVVSGMMVRYQMPAMGMFELTRVGLPIALAGLAYVWVIGRRLLPARAPAAGPEDDQFGLRPYLTEVLVRPDSALAGKTLAESSFGRELDLIVLRIIRDGKYHPARAATKLEAGDVLLVEGRREEILRIKDTAGIDIRADAEFSINDPGADGLRLAEGILMPRSTLIGRTLKGTRFRERYGLQVLAINRHAAVLRQKLSDVRLATGDVLLLQGPPEQIRSLDGQNVRILGAIEDRTYNLSRARTSVLIFSGVLAVGTVGWIPFPVAVLIGVVLALASRCITPEEAYREVEWKVIVLIGSMLAVGQAMDRTHAAEFLAGRMIDVLAGASPVALLGGFFALTVLLTQPMSNQAAAIVVLPIAVQAAQQLSLNPRTFAMMVAVAASCSYLTPLEPSCLMVYGPGRYRFSDFLKVGSLLTVIIFLIAIALVPRFWPLAAPAAR